MNSSSSKLTMNKSVLVLFRLSLLVLLFGLLDGKRPISKGRLIYDWGGQQLFPGSTYYIFPRRADFGGGGLNLIKTGNSTCPNTILQSFPNITFGLPIYPRLTGITNFLIYEASPLGILMAKKPECVESSESVVPMGPFPPDSSRWLVFVDNSIQKTCVGIGGPEGHPGQQTYNGTVHIQILEDDPIGYSSYTLMFCFDGSNYQNCSDIGTYYNGEGGRRLILTETNPFIVAFHSAENHDGTIKSLG